MHRFSEISSMISRKEETKTLEKALQSTESEFIAVFGRRRVGKTYLINSVYERNLCFEFTGLQDGNKNAQLKNFYLQLKKFFPNIKFKRHKNWLDAFATLIEAIEIDIKLKKNKPVIFIDELPWLATKKSGFLSALSYFWNSWAVKKNVVVVVCGSAASWMIKNVINEKGGLYNRVTRRIQLHPFNLKETEEFLISRNVNLNRDQIIQLYMAMGGIPHYLKAVEPGMSASQNIQNICFQTNGLLLDEFSKLYEALFDNATIHKVVVNALFEKNKGLTRQEIINNAKLTDSGVVSKVLEELEQSGFIQKVHSFDNVKSKIVYRLIDEYSLFYLTYINGKTSFTFDHWIKVAQSQNYKIWTGYAFENLCFRHISEIKKSLSINGIKCEIGSFYHKDNEQGAQIDLIIDRADHCVNIVECKFYNDPFYISKDLAMNIRKKRSAFTHFSKSKKQVFITVVSPLGIIPNKESIGLVDNEVIGEELFLS